MITSKNNWLQFPIKILLIISCTNAAMHFLNILESLWAIGNCKSVVQDSIRGKILCSVNKGRLSRYRILNRKQTESAIVLSI